MLPLGKLIAQVLREQLTDSTAKRRRQATDEGR